jgi:hypothetical protein
VVKGLGRVAKDQATLADPRKSALIRLHGHAEAPQGAAGPHGHSR